MIHSLNDDTRIKFELWDGIHFSRESNGRNGIYNDDIQSDAVVTEIGGGTNASFSVCADCGRILPKGRALCDKCLDIRLRKYDEKYESSNEKNGLVDGVCNKCGCILPKGQFICDDCVDDYTGYEFLVGGLRYINDPEVKKAAREVVKIGYCIDWKTDHGLVNDLGPLRDEFAIALANYRKKIGIDPMIKKQNMSSSVDYHGLQQSYDYFDDMH